MVAVDAGGDAREDGSQVAGKTYKHPPITEAVIELRSTIDSDTRSLGKLRSRLVRDYAKSEDLNEVKAQVMVGGPGPTIEQSLMGHILTSADGAEYLQFTRRSLIAGRRAPYAGWDPLVQRLREARKAWNATVGRQPLERIGVRYIDRIDVPWDAPEKPVVEEADYLNAGTVRMPAPYSLNTSFAARVEGRLGAPGFGYILQTSSVPPAMIEHTSLSLDIDVYYMAEGLMRDETIWERLIELREYKNELFEAFITDRTRKLIDV